MFISYPLNIVQAYLHSMHNIAVTFNLTPVLQKKAKNSEYSKRLEAVSIDFDFYKIQYYLSRSRLNAILFVLEHFS